jgi:predicted transcriptional regulator
VDLEEVLCSKTTIKMLKTIVRLGQLNVSDVAHRVGANYIAVLARLRMLESEGIPQQRTSGRARYYRLSEHSPRAMALQCLIEAWERERKYPSKRKPQ